ncbi:hypothetical protein BaRGS_00011269, partial [Batillaria attramentaria]
MNIPCLLIVLFIGCSVNPAVDYDWLGVECENGKTHNTCRYVPNVTDNGTLVACVAINLTESEQSSVTIQCEASGRPGPRLLLSRTSHDGTVNLTDTNQSNEDVTVTSLDHTVIRANWTDMGNYTCVAWNGVGVKDSATMTLNVNWRDVAEKFVGVYKARISNDFGVVEYFFVVEDKISGADNVTNSISGPFAVAIAGGVAGGLISVSIAIVVTLPPFANSEEGIVNYANTEPRPSQAEDHNYVNYETRQNTYEEMQPRSES